MAKQKLVTKAQAPVAKKSPVITELHGDKLVDNYAWMRDKEPLKNKALVAHLNAENAFADSFMADTAAMQETLYREIRGRVKEADADVPYKQGKWLYYSRTQEGKQYEVLCRKLNKPNAAEEIILNVDALAEGHEFFSLGSVTVSPSGNFLAYSYDVIGYRQYKLAVKNLRTRTGALLDVTAERVTSIAWASDNRTLIYTTEDATTKRSNQVWRHKIGQKKHHLVFEEPDEMFSVEVGRSRSDKFIYLKNGSHTTSTVSFIKANEPTAKFKPLMQRKPLVKHSVEDDGKHFYILTNDDAVDFKLMKASVRRPKVWTELITHRSGTLMEDVVVLNGRIAVFEKTNGLTQVRIQDLSCNDVHYIEFPEAIYEVSAGDNPEQSTTALRLVYFSMVSPPTTFDYDMASRKLTTLKVKEVIGYDASQYKTERVYATARDGTPVPISLVYKKDLKLDGSRPCHVYGYGSYGYGLPPNFREARISLLDRGYVYAIAHIRGGNELGEQWRLDGKLKKKMNTFTDFIDCIKHLVKEGYTQLDRVTMEGGSAGGLLMGAVLNLDPKIACAAILDVPFVDVINTMLDESLPLTVGEFEEWGNPKVKEDYDYMKLYSPYDNIEAKDYPAMLVRTAISDSQVPYWEAAKYVAKQRELRTDSNVLLLKTMMEVGGHGGPSGRFDAMKDIAHDYAFMLKHVAHAAWKQ